MEKRTIYVVSYASNFDEDRFALETSVFESEGGATEKLNEYKEKYENDEEVALTNYDDGFYAEYEDEPSMGWCRCSITSISL